MSSFERRVQSVSRQELGRFAERLLPDQCPDLKPLVDTMSQLLKLSMDIKSEMAMLDSYVRSSDNLRENEENNDREGDLSGGSIGDEVKRRLRELIMDWVFGDDEGGDGILDMIKDLLLNWAGEKLNDVGWQWEEILDLYRTLADTITLLQLSDISGKLGGPFDNYPLHTYQIVSEINKHAMDIQKFLTDGYDKEDTLKTVLQSITTGITDGTSLLDAAIKALNDDIKQAVMLQNLFLDQLYSKIEDCCVKDEVSTLLEKTSDITDDVDEVKTLLRGGTPTSTRNAQGEIMTQLRVIQGQIDELRRLL